MIEENTRKKGNCKRERKLRSKKIREREYERKTAN
jgi:hypothetical protein